MKTSTRTVVISAANPYPVALAQDESREFAIITALDSVVVLSDSWAEVQDPANLVTGLATAMMDSVPLVILAGQVISPMLGKDAFQESDISGITVPITWVLVLVPGAVI